MGIPPGANPFSGRPDGAGNQVLIVKIPDTGRSRPQMGLNQADIVYVEEVEWGLNRFAAVFSSTFPDRIGPIRSARITDIDLTAQFGKPALAFSGAQTKLLPLLKAASIVDVDGTLGGTGYHQDTSRRSPDDYYINPEEVMTRAPEASKSKDIGFVFGPAPAGGTKTTDVETKWDDSSVGFTWVESEGAYQVVLDGTPATDSDGKPLLASTVVIQSVISKDSGFGDKFGGHTPKAETIGTGTAVVLRDGKRWDTTWTRPDAASGTVFTLADGSKMPFKVGTQWIDLYDSARKATYK